MKKLINSKLKFILIAMLLLIAVIMCLSVQPVNAQSIGTQSLSLNFDESYADLFLNEFIADYGNRTTGNSHDKDRIYEEKAADFLQSKFEELGLEEYFSTVPSCNNVQKTKYHQKFEYTVDNYNYHSYNVAGIKKASVPTEKTVYIGAGYDNVANYKDSQGNNVGGEGACSNATGVATMMAIAKSLPDDLNFNVVFVAFGASKLSIKGSEYFVQSMNNNQASNALLMINLDGIGSGDYLYLYTDEEQTTHQTFITGIAASNGIQIKNPPENKKIMTGKYFANDLSYTHYGLQTDSVRFRNRRILSASFMSLNWEDNKYAAVQSVLSPIIIDTSEDTLANLKKYYPQYNDVMNDVSLTVLSTLSDENFVATMEKAKTEIKDYSIWISKGLYIGISAGLILGLIGMALAMYYYNKSKAVKKGEKIHCEPPIQPKVNIKEEDIFGMGSHDDDDKHDSVFGDDFD